MSLENVPEDGLFAEDLPADLLDDDEDDGYIYEEEDELDGIDELNFDDE